MVEKLFVFGLPGSGKSSLIRHISMCAQWRKLPATHINDYDILYQMFLEDTQGQFRLTAYDGFDVLDVAVFDTALKKLEEYVKALISTAQLEEIVLIEFSRNNYENAFQQFSKEFLLDSYFLYLNVDQENCKKRIFERISHPTTLDDHFVSEYIFDAYYREDDGLSLSSFLERDYKIDKSRVLVIDNNCSLEVATRKIDGFINRIFTTAVQDSATGTQSSVTEDIQSADDEIFIIYSSEEPKGENGIVMPILETVGSVRD